MSEYEYEDEKEQSQYVKLRHFGLPKLKPYLKSVSRTILAMCVLNVVANAMDSITPLFQQYAINHFIALGTLDTLVPFILLYILVQGVMTVTNSVAAAQAGKIEMNVDYAMRKACFNHLQTLSFSYFNQNSVGYIQARVISDTARIGELVAWSLSDAVGILTYMIGCLIIMFRINWKLALLVLVVVPVAVLISSYFQKKLTKLNRRVREINSQISSNFNEGITGAETTKTLVAEKRMEEDFNETSAKMYRTSVRATHYRALYSSLISMTTYIALALILWRGGLLTLNGLMELGTLSVFATYAMNLLDPIQWVVNAFSNLINVQVNIERFTRLMDTQSDVADTPEVIEKYGDTFNPKKENWEPLYGDVEFKDVSFKYPDGDEYVLEHFNLKVPQGTNVAIVGETGAGKSTLVNLVCRFYEPTSGQILIDGRDARERSQLWLHSNIGYVLQTPHLFSGTVKENLLYGKPDATQEELDRAVKAVHADQVIARLDKGYDTDVGEGGDLLSTGEKQLISFARAILADPRIFVLDEATSSIDTVTEKLIQSAIAEVMKGRTSFVIAHRLSTIRKSDVILVVHDGKIIERGTHKELMNMKGSYYHLYTRQLEDESVQNFS